MAMKVISESIGFDGRGFFCRLCGKANYKSLPAVKGHLAMCPGKAIQKGAVPGPQLAVQPATASRSLAGYSNYQSSVETTSQQLQQQPLYDYYQLDTRLTRVENEYNHMLLERNTPSQSWFSQHKEVLIIAAVFFGYLLLSSSGSRCQCPESLTGSARGSDRTSGFVDMAGKLVHKMGDRMVTKSIDRILA